MNLKNKKVLITAGPTWVPIDNVRVISNIATGRTGILLAEKLQDLGAQVTLLLGPAESCCLDRGIKLIPFKFFDELKRAIKKELKSKRYDMVIHSAAVADYKPQARYRQKIKSGKKNWKINFVPTVKIIDLIKRIDKSLFLVGFKFEPNANKNVLIKRARDLMQRAKLDLVVANRINKRQYQGYVINQNKIYGPLKDRRRLAKKLISIIGI